MQLADPTRNLLGLDASAWTAIGTGALAVSTVALVIVTGRLIQHSRKAAESAERAALSAEKSAEATMRSVLVAEAVMELDFKADVSLSHTAGAASSLAFFTLRNLGPRIWLHRVDLAGAYFQQKSGGLKSVNGMDLEMQNLPGFFQRNDLTISKNLILGFEATALEFAWLELHYSVAVDTDKHVFKVVVDPGQA